MEMFARYFPTFFSKQFKLERPSTEKLKVKHLGECFKRFESLKF